MGLRVRRPAYVATIIAIVGFFAAGSATAKGPVKWMEGAHPSGTPAKLDRVGVLKIGPKSAPNVLVFEPGGGGGAGKLVPWAQVLVKRLPGWQVWAVERRQNLLEDQSVMNRAKRGRASPRKVFDYYLHWMTDPSITHHVAPVPDAAVGFARDWGMAVAVRDLRQVIKAAARKGRRVVLGGHSLGGAITTAYATWDFNGKPGVNGLSGLVYEDGGSNPEPISAAAATQMLQGLQHGSPWASEGGTPAPYSGLLPGVLAAQAKMDPNGSSVLQDWSEWPSDLTPPVPVTNEALFGFAVDTQTSPPSLATVQVHAGHLAVSGDPRAWVRGGEISPIQRYARAFSGWGVKDVDGTEWYYPARLLYDSLALADGNANPAQDILDLKATHGDDIDVPVYAFSTAFGASNLFGPGGVLGAALTLAQQSHLPARKLTLVDRRDYAHNDPNAAYPDNAFLDHLVPFLRGIAKR